MTLLPRMKDHGEFDVLSGRGKGFYDHLGNKRLRDIVCQHTKKFTACESHDQRVALLNQIVEKVALLNGGKGRARFLKKQMGKWVEIAKPQAREKVRHIMSEALQGRICRSNARKGGSVARAKEEDNGPNSLPAVLCGEPAFLKKHDQLLCVQQSLFCALINASGTEVVTSATKMIESANAIIDNFFKKHNNLLSKQQRIYSELLNEGKPAPAVKRALDEERLAPACKRVCRRGRGKGIIVASYTSRTRASSLEQSAKIFSELLDPGKHPSTPSDKGISGGAVPACKQGGRGRRGDVRSARASRRAPAL